MYDRSLNMLEIIYQDDHLVAINKPHGLLVHRSPIAADATEFAIQLLRDQLGCRVHPVHRLDRKTGGVLLFALTKEVEVQVQALFAAHRIQKSYLALVRGYTPDRGEIDYPLTAENGISQEAHTAYRTLGRTELPLPFGQHPTSRYSLVEARPTTGRMHQLRKHFAHIRHPIIGDRPHGCNKQNGFFKAQWNMTTLLLHATSLRFSHPVTGLDVTIVAGIQEEFRRMTAVMGWSAELHG